ncbi:hypothetical protein J1N35_007552 [Gossypium stocksii]|uniref:Uncharacterized protein n=1 Tax=Gossypium stocksii TaxID=47602 RepID=A0A9D3W6B4_9ROSI|nr:hypothetical protein J1N35_007552 [Gossypium stocksii]
MIRWMQESKSIFQEFVKQNNIWVPNYTPNMFGPMPFGQEEIEHESKEEGEGDGSDEMDEEEDH